MHAETHNVQIRGATWSDENEPLSPSHRPEKNAPVENTERVFSGTRDISDIKYVAELLGSLTEKPQEARDLPAISRKRTQMWESRINFRRVIISSSNIRHNNTERI